MREALSLFELIVVCFILSLIVILSWNRQDYSLYHATQNLLYHIKYTQKLALQDSRYFLNPSSTALTKSLSPSIDERLLLSSPLKNMWQIQFHTTGTYTQNSYSIYNDTPRISPTTNYDGRPMSGDFIAIESNNNQCLSGYNNTNVSDYCKNNTHPNVRLKEKYGIEEIILEGEFHCVERGGGRVFFDEFGRPYCGKTPALLKRPLKITLKKDSQTLTITILPISGYSFISD